MIVRLFEEGGPRPWAPRPSGVEVVEGSPCPDMAQINALSNIIIGAEASACHATLDARSGRRIIRRRMRAPARARLPSCGGPAISRRSICAGPLLDGFGEALFRKGRCADDAGCWRMPVPTIAETDVAGLAANAADHGEDHPRDARPINYLGLPALSLPAGFTGRRDALRDPSWWAGHSPRRCCSGSAPPSSAKTGWGRPRAGPWPLAAA